MNVDIAINIDYINYCQALELLKKAIAENENKKS